MRKKSSTLLGRRKLAIIITSVLIVMLVVALVLVLDFVNATAVTDTADGTVYYVREKKNVYSLYDTDKKTVLPTESTYGYYITHAGTLVEVDAETGEYEIIASVETEGNEAVGFNNRVLIFPHLEKKDILKLEVHNSEGEFTFVRRNLTTGKEDASASFIIDGSPLTVYDQELFASLHVSAGYTLTTLKIKDPIKDENGQFSEYGLVPEIRTREVTDENGEFVLDENLDYTYEQYAYEPAYYVITDTSGNTYKLIIGDKLVTGGGYYVQYVDTATDTKRDAVYVLSADIGDTLLAPIEKFVTPQLTYPMTLNTYLWVEDFYIAKKNPDWNVGDNEDKKFISPVSFSFVPLEERENTIYVHTPFFFTKGFELDGYEVSTDNINEALGAIYQPAFKEVVAFNPTDKELVEYGLATVTGKDENGKPKYELDSEYVISFNYDAYDETTSKVIATINNSIYVSEIDGRFYAFTVICPIDENGSLETNAQYTLNMIVEIESHTFDFLGWDRFDWINDKYISNNIAYVDKIEITDHQSGYSSVFELDNSKTDVSQNVASDLLQVTASDSNGNLTTTFSQMTVVDTSGNTWIITSSEIKCYSPSGSELKITSAYYDYNSLGKQVRANKGQIHSIDGRLVTVNADTIVINGAENVTLSRYDTELFRRFYQTLLYSTISNTYEMSEEDEQALLGDPSKLLLTMKISDTEGGYKEYKFYKLTSRKAYITISTKEGKANGGFYVLSGRVEKFVSDSQRFFKLEDIDETGKY